MHIQHDIDALLDCIICAPREGIPIHFWGTMPAVVEDQTVLPHLRFPSAEANPIISLHASSFCMSGKKISADAAHSVDAKSATYR